MKGLGVLGDVVVGEMSMDTCASGKGGEGESNLCWSWRHRFVAEVGGRREGGMYGTGEARRRTGDGRTCCAVLYCHAAYLSAECNHTDCEWRTMPLVF